MTTAVASARRPTQHPGPAVRRRLKIAYVMSRFPKLTETFVLYELLALEEQGVDTAIYPLLRGCGTPEDPERATLFSKFRDLLRARPATVMHAEAGPLVERAHYTPFLNWAILKSQLWFLWRRPLAYCRALAALVRGTWGSRNYLLGGLAYFPKAVHLAARMQADRVDHIHAHFASHPAAVAFVIHRLTGIPFSFTGHGHDLHVDTHMLREKVAEAAAVITISEYNRELIVAECGEQFREKVHVVHCGVDTRVFRPASVRDEASRDRPFTIACVGTLYEVKGQRYLIEACRLLLDRGVDFECHFVGDGGDLESLQRQATESGLNGRIRFHGRQTRAAIAERLAGSDVLVAPSVPTACGRREGIPVVLMEAMASGLPVVASRISGIPELVEDEVSGLLVPPRDIPALADALEQLARNPGKRQQLGRAGREKVVTEFDIRRNAALLVRQFAAIHARADLEIAEETA